MGDSLIIELIKLGSVIVATCVAIYGISSWRRESVGKRRIQLAEDILALFYEVRDQFPVIRDPWLRPTEGKSRERSNLETQSDSQVLDQVHSVFERFRKVEEPFNKLRSLKYRAMATFGAEWEAPFKRIDDQVRKIFNAARRLSVLWRRNVQELTEEQFEKHQADIEKYEKVFWEWTEDDDPINAELQIIGQQLEALCKAEIQSGVSLTVSRLFTRDV